MQCSCHGWVVKAHLRLGTRRYRALGALTLAEMSGDVGQTLTRSDAPQGGDPAMSPEPMRSAMAPLSLGPNQSMVLRTQTAPGETGGGVPVGAIVIGAALVAVTAYILLA